jgi:hypothetical protein
MIPLVGFLPARDPRVRGTIEAIEEELVEGGFVLRYRTKDTGDVDGLSGREGAFLACSFWLADCLSMLGRDHDARQLLDRLMDLRNDLGLLSEEYDPVAGRLVGNFPQAFSHVSLVNSASKIDGQEKPSAHRVITGLAQRAVARSKSRGGAIHLRGLSAQDMLTTLAQNAAPDVPRSVAAQTFRSAVAQPRRSSPARPTVPPSVRGTVKMTAKSRAKSRPAPSRHKPGKVTNRAAAKATTNRAKRPAKSTTKTATKSTKKTTTKSTTKRAAKRTAKKTAKKTAKSVKAATTRPTKPSSAPGAKKRTATKSVSKKETRSAKPTKRAR